MRTYNFAIPKTESDMANAVLPNIITSKNHDNRSPWMKRFSASGKSGRPANLLGTIILRPPDKTVTEKIVESQQISIKENSSNAVQDSQPQRGNVIDWFLGVVGARPPESNQPGEAGSPQVVSDCPPCTCGEVLQHVRIVGGIETLVNEFPWMTALMYNNRFYCGASLINNKYVLTAAHCVNGFSKERITAVFLDHDRSTSTETQTITRKIKTVHRHRSYGSGSNYNNDIAVLQLDEEVSLSGKLQPVCLPPTGKSFSGYTGVAVGWGATKQNGQTASKLQEVKVPIMSNVDCKKTGYGSRITDNMVCAGYPEGKKDSCQGDSGGPLLVQNGTAYQIVGIVSWGEGCAQANYPGVYTRVNRYISWIKSLTRDACYC
ncbi:unnamed protein product [Acanthoscelides obtectus]|uniref:Peptidase S1 domain-containing protein n=1 Tax=Acanthoscelides obtectus TaxID=200917 RepID=A0A9P0LP15_ACAOB|nr:unnamed protein product [Acanthoscelides obtectus]CAK1640595.1 hypothetical protein AOBTE_LOCUS11819 [Acanthoscelides obtectus]